MIELILSTLLQHPDMAASAATAITAPGVVDVSKLGASLADMSRQVLKCYHHTARFSSVDVLGTPWARQGQYGAQASLVIRITFTGLSAQQYQMVVAVMAKQGAARAAVLSDSAIMRPSGRCQLEEWTSI